MSIIFNAADHSYKSIDSTESINWISVTSLVSNFKKPFDAKAVAARVTKSKKSKWYGIAPEKILEIWDNEANRATTLGTYYHNQREADLCSFASMERDGITIPVISPVEEIDGLKQAPSQRLDPGVYPEHMVFLKSAGICGQSDLVEVIDGTVHITDYKTNKEIKLSGFTNWEGITQKMAPPLSHLDDCNLNHYALQLSMYLFIILKHNPKLKPGALTIHHILFEEVGRDKFDNPITALDTNGDPIVLDVVQYDLPYLKKEAISVIHWLEDNKHKLKPKN
jgi:hypothetical protein